MSPSKLLIKFSTLAILHVLAFLARRPRLQWLSDLATRGLARLTWRLKRLGVARTTGELGELWQRSFPFSKQVPIEHVAERTVIGQIHTRCPLRGSGDLTACQRMMEYDREVLRQAGGQLIVVQSQASPGVEFCRVAMRLAGESVEDLVPAHRQPADLSPAQRPEMPA